MSVISRHLSIGVLAASLVGLSGASAFAAPRVEHRQTMRHHRHGKFIKIDSMQRDGGHTGASHRRAYDPYNGGRSAY